MSNAIRHYIMGDVKSVSLDFVARMIVVDNNTPAYAYIRTGGNDIPIANNADISIRPWQKEARPIIGGGTREFGIRVMSDTNPFPNVTPDFSITFYESIQAIAFTTATPTNNPTPSVSHILLDGNSDSDTVAHVATAGDIIFANAATPSLWQALAIGVTNAVLQVVGGLPAWVSSPIVNALTSLGDISVSVGKRYLVGTAAVTPQDAGIAGQLLITDGTTPQWYTLASAGSYHNASQSIAATGNDVVLAFNTNRWNLGAVWASGSNTRLTAPVAGKYHVSLILRFTSVTVSTPAGSYVAIRLNGGATSFIAIGNPLLTAASGALMGLELDTIWNFAANDYIEAVVNNKTTAAFNVAASGGANYAQGSCEFRMQQVSNV